MELAGEQTVLFSRWEFRNGENLLGRTYGLHFEEAMTSVVPGCERSTSHHRIVKYDFFGLKLVVRCEVDACLLSVTPNRGTSPVTQSSDPDDLTEALAGLNITTNPPATPAGVLSSPSMAFLEGSLPLRIIRAGAAQLQESIIELTTRSEDYTQNLDWAEVFPQLYLSQTPHLYVGVHSVGRFFDVRKQSLDSLEMISQREKAETSLRKLGNALRMIQKIVVKHGRAGRLSLVCEKGTLRAYERVSTQSCLPAEVIQRFEK
ncbi:hypothetical protein HETIRDRAFT_168757 [Heterobasidion irregulare TC 32-1]|uniref:Uncharacterized protein n=1 Tax=Heterobasidion irregulare (strain TC 32-1) TaxID=747525 RepID=W4K948_HETIT|nr:uncharacterized protein HETIRDRAFT_168757 [Heterobasidion irregulare TC 32-1]ETW82298.1 hypothetical protein HETIRDRAFT_168757 [Heterobasidion irregulare TC 32-1]